MKNILLTLIIAIHLPELFAQTVILGGNINGTWTLSGSPYLVQGSITIPKDSTLIIEQGVTVEFQGTYKLLVLGRLLAIGTVTDSITFAPADTAMGWRGIRFDNTPVTNDTSKLIYCRLEYGKATGTSPDDKGGALYFNSFTKAIISYSRITNCTANSSGGGIYCTSSSPTISNNTISNNTALGTQASDGGGGIYSITGSPTITNNIISSNTVSKQGGGIYCNNYNGSGITNNIISNNSARNGGGIFCYLGTPAISNNAISNNTASVYGGGGIDYYSISYTSGPSITSNIISNNAAFTGGGGIYCNSQFSTISNNSISNNAASTGGGIHCNGKSPKITNNTISNNYATIEGGALFCGYTSNPIIRNTILWGNTSSGNGPQVHLDFDSSDPDFYYCNVQGGTAAFGLNGGSYTGSYSNNIDTNPFFVAPSGGSGTGFNGLIADWSLDSSSSCIDAGDPATNSPATDNAGNPRVTVCRVDIGAYEYQTGVPLTATVSQTQQILCFGESTAVAEIIAAGGVMPYAYLWSSSDTTDSISGLTAGTYCVTVTELSGCSLNVCITISEPFLVQDSTTVSICDNDSILLQGGYQNTPGTYLDTLTAVNGCDSIITTILMVNSLPSIPTITANGTILTSSSTVGNQWYLNDTIIISGATSQNYSVTQNGNYTVVVTDSNGCSATSAIYNFTSIGFSELTSDNSFIITPNPSYGKFQLHTNNIISGKIKIYNVIGNIIFESAIHDIDIDLSNQPRGIYSIVVTMQDKSFNKKLIIQ